MRLHQLFIISLLWITALTRLPAQRPQGSDQGYVALAAKGSALLALSADGKILQSTDGGASYSELHSVGAGDALYDLAANGEMVVAVGKDGLILRADFSVDNTAWTETNSSGIFGDLRGVDHNGASVWVAVGAVLMRSTDNGASWADVTPASFGFFDEMHAVIFTGTGSNWVAVGEGASGGIAFYSTNGGADWTASTLPSVPALLALGVDSAGNLLAVGEGGTVLLSTDQGVSFSALSSVNVSQNLNGVQSSGEGQWLIGGIERVLLSVDSSLDSSETVLAPVAAGSLDTANDILLVDGSLIMAGVAGVPAPQITAPVTTSFASIDVTLVPDVSTDQTFYTLDGSSPDSTDLLYSAPFSISETLTVSAVSRLDGVYSPVASQAFDITIHTLSIAPNGSDIDLTLDASVNGYNYQLQRNPDLRDSGGWTNEAAAKSGSGSPLAWTVLNPAGSLSWRVVISVSP